SGSGDPPCLFRVTGGSVRAQGCTFSTAGPHRHAVAFRLDDGDAAGPEPATPRKVRLSRCLLRGAHLSVLDVRAGSAEVLVEDCLALGGDQPLVLAANRTGAPPTVRVARSTLVASGTLVRVKPAAPNDPKPGLHWHGWDTLLANAGEQARSVLLDLDE